LRFTGIIVSNIAKEIAVTIGAKYSEPLLFFNNQKRIIVSKIDSKIPIDCNAISGLTSKILA
jgi:hypothetical protein